MCVCVCVCAFGWVGVYIRTLVLCVQVYRLKNDTQSALDDIEKAIQLCHGETVCFASTVHPQSPWRH